MEKIFWPHTEHLLPTRTWWAKLASRSSWNSKKHQLSIIEWVDTSFWVCGTSFQHHCFSGNEWECFPGNVPTSFNLMKYWIDLWRVPRTQKTLYILSICSMAKLPKLICFTWRCIICMWCSALSSLLSVHACVARKARSSYQQLTCLSAQLWKSHFFSSSDESWEL